MEDDDTEIEIAALTPDLTGNLDTPTDTQLPLSILGAKKMAKGKNTASPSLFQQQLLSALNKSQNEDDDDDKYFLLTLLPGLKQIDNESKMDARIKLMQVVQKYSRKRVIESNLPFCQQLQPVQYPVL